MPTNNHTGVKSILKPYLSSSSSSIVTNKTVKYIALFKKSYLRKDKQISEF